MLGTPTKDSVRAFTELVDCPRIGFDTALSDPTIDAVVVHCKSQDMVSISLQALAAGKGVHVEKPGGAGLNDLRDLAHAQQDTGLVVRVGYNFHLAPSIAQAQTAIDGGELGKVSLVRAHSASSRGEHLTAHQNQRADMGGGLWVLGGHAMQILLKWFGIPSEVSAVIEKFPSLSDDSSREDVAALTLKYPDKLVTFDFTVHENTEWWETTKFSTYGDAGVEALRTTSQSV